MGHERSAAVAPDVDVGQLTTADDVKPVGILHDQETISPAHGTEDPLETAVSPCSTAFSKRVAQTSPYTSENPQISTPCASLMRASSTSGRTPRDATWHPTTRGVCAETTRSHTASRRGMAREMEQPKGG
jgi:hypothetical protein